MGFPGLKCYQVGRILLMRLFRIGASEQLENYSGLGASYRNGARWNRPGIPVMYFALSASVAMIEMASYIPSPHMIPEHYRMGIYEISDKAALKILTLSELPDDWKNYPYPLSTQISGSEILQNPHYAGFIVPSAASPVIDNDCVIINPENISDNQLKLTNIESEIYSPRMFTGISGTPDDGCNH